MGEADQRGRRDLASLRLQETVNVYKCMARTARSSDDGESDPSSRQPIFPRLLVFEGEPLRGGLNNGRWNSSGLIELDNTTHQPAPSYAASRTWP